jgi:hypothetical protein
MVAPTRADAGRAFPNLIVQRPEKISHQLRVVHFAKTPAWILQCAGSHPRRRWDHAARHAHRRSICSIHPLESERSGGTLGILDATTPPIRAGRRDIDATDACPAGSFRHRTRWQEGGRPTGGLFAGGSTILAPLGLLEAPSLHPLAGSWPPRLAGCRWQHGPRTRWPAGTFRHRTRWREVAATDMHCRTPGRAHSSCSLAAHAAAVEGRRSARLMA